MKLYLLPLLLLLILITSCKKECEEPALSVDETQLAIDVATIDAYLTRKGIEAEIHPSGIRYVIKREGEGNRPNACSTISASYTGNHITDDSEFDTSAGQIITWGLQEVITGWQIGVPLIKEGGRITLYIPSVYAYGTTGQGSIQPNESLIFEILLFGVN